MAWHWHFANLGAVWLSRLVVVPWLVLAVALGQLEAEDWPQWRGPNRNNVSTETGLLSVWPDDGPPLAWEFKSLGDGVVPVAVAGGRVYCTGNRDGSEYCHALSETDGQLIWSVNLGPAAAELALMRWLNQRTPTVDGDRLYAVMVSGDYVCLEAATGKELWRLNALERFHSRRHNFGYCDYPLVDGDRLIITPGGSNASIAALDKHTGKVLWTSFSEAAGGQVHSSLIAAEFHGVRQYVNKLQNALIGIRATDGKLLWEYPLPGPVTSTHSPLAEGHTIYYASGYKAGQHLLELQFVDNGFVARPIYVDRSSINFAGWLGSVTQVDNHIFANPAVRMACIERSTGKPTWQDGPRERFVYTIANHQLYVWTNQGRLGLAALDTQQYRELCAFKPFDRLQSTHGITFPVVANGRLYVRNLERLMCFNVRAPGLAGKKNPDAVFVPTPEDVVAPLLELADIEETDLVVDLGSGDGRLLIGAALAYGCRGIGVEIDSQLVENARAAADKARVSDRLRFEHADLFNYDFSQANVLLLYILPEMLNRLKPKFASLPPGTRIVCHEFAIPGVQAECTIDVASAEDEQMRRLYRYVLPLKEASATALEGIAEAESKNK